MLLLVRKTGWSLVADAGPAPGVGKIAKLGLWLVRLWARKVFPGAHATLKPRGSIPRPKNSIATANSMPRVVTNRHVNLERTSWSLMLVVASY